MAFLCLVLAIAGVFLPLLPATPFLLASAWFAARSSPRLSHWLETHPRFGPLIRDWRDTGALRRRSKWAATAAMAASAVLLLVVVPQWWMAAVAIGTMAIVLAWLWMRPEPPAAD